MEQEKCLNSNTGKAKAEGKAVRSHKVPKVIFVIFFSFLITGRKHIVLFSHNTLSFDTLFHNCRRMKKKRIGHYCFVCDNQVTHLVLLQILPFRICDYVGSHSVRWSKDNILRVDNTVAIRMPFHSQTVNVVRFMTGSTVVWLYYSIEIVLWINTRVHMMHSIWF